jgi:hypothetical protein
MDRAHTGVATSNDSKQRSHSEASPGSDSALHASATTGPGYTEKSISAVIAQTFKPDCNWPPYEYGPAGDQQAESGYTSRPLVLPSGLTIPSSIGVNDPTRHFEHTRRTYSALRRSHIVNTKANPTCSAVEQSYTARSKPWEHRYANFVAHSNHSAKQLPRESKGSSSNTDQASAVDC